MATLLELLGESDKGQLVAVRASGIDKDPHPPFLGIPALLPSSRQLVQDQRVGWL